LCLSLAALVCAPIIGVKRIDASADGVAEIAMEQTSGAILHEKNADRQLPMASTTKIMTALIVCEECDLSEVITIDDRAVGIEGSSIYLKKGEQLSVKDLVYGLMLRSGNDAACALAIHHSGSVDKFVERMNERATELGADNTHFGNPHGLPCEGHHTTARDLCNIARYAMSNENFNAVVSTKHYVGDFRSYTNKNKLLNSLEGANGVKTGYTEKAGRCLVSSAKRDNMDVVCVVLNCYDMFERSAKIINSCFDRYAVEVISKDRIFTADGLSFTLGEDCYITVPRGASLAYSVEVQQSTESGTIAKLQIFNKNNLIFSHDLFTI
ncbi:MAG: D-alanyl-D-alanine carboxypeptidase, partial [Clostridia bacterium]|nr:D-alanyl-D-alanine carboxypeptidase [Clostridia bacterium]